MIQLPGFLLGASTAAFQIEGAARADGKGESIWDRFCHTPGKVQGGDTSDFACDFYHRFEEDPSTAPLGEHWLTGDEPKALSVREGRQAGIGSA